LADFSKAIEIDPKSADAYNNRGSAKRDLQNYQGAIADFSKAIGDWTRNILMLTSTAEEANYHLQDYLGAIADYSQKPLRLTRNILMPYLNRGSAKDDFTGLSGSHC